MDFWIIILTVASCAVGLLSGLLDYLSFPRKFSPDFSPDSSAPKLFLMGHKIAVGTISHVLYEFVSLGIALAFFGLVLHVQTIYQRD